MTTIEAPAIYQVVEAPEGIDRKFGLFSVATFEDLGPHAGLGIQWTSQACAVVQQTQNACIDPGVAALTGDQCGVVSQAVSSPETNRARACASCTSRD